MPRRFPTDLSRRSVIGLLGLGAVLLNTRGHSELAQATPSADPDYASLQTGHFIWHSERVAKGPGRHHRVDSEAAHLRLPQRHPDRRFDLLDRQAGPFDARRRLEAALRRAPPR